MAYVQMATEGDKRTCITFSVTSSVHLPVLGISLHHFHPKSLCFGMQQHWYSLSEKTCSS